MFPVWPHGPLGRASIAAKPPITRKDFLSQKGSRIASAVLLFASYDSKPCDLNRRAFQSME